MKSSFKKPLKNYVIAIIVVLAIVFITFYIVSWFKVYEQKEMKSPFTGFCSELQYNELENSLVETPNSYFIYISYTNDNDAYQLEKKVKRIIVDNDLQSKIYYLNVTSEKDNSDFINELNTKLNLEDKKIENIPAIIYFNGGKVVNIINSTDVKVFDTKQLNELIKKYKIEQ